MNVLSIGKNDFLNYYYKLLFENLYNTKVRIFNSAESVPFFNIKESKIIIVGSNIRADSLEEKINKSKRNDIVIFNSSSEQISDQDNHFFHPFDVSSINYHIKKNNLLFKRTKMDHYIEIPYKILDALAYAPCQIYTKRSQVQYDLAYSVGQPIRGNKKEYFIKKEDYSLFFKQYLVYLNREKKKILQLENLKSYVNFSYELFNQEDILMPKDHLIEMNNVISDTITSITDKKNALDILNKILNQDNFFINHSFYTLYLASYINKELFGEYNNYRKIVISSIFHDFKLDWKLNEKYEKMVIRNNSIDNDNFHDHTTEALDILRKLNIYDTDINNMIKSHHASPILENISNFRNLEFIFNISHFISVLKLNDYSNKEVLQEILIYKNSHPLFEHVYSLISDIFKA